MPRKTGKRNTLASQADKYDLYLRSVQEPSYETGFFDRVFRRRYGRRPLILREDFCGTAAVCAEWVKSHPERRAYGIDLDPVPLAWGRKHNLTPLVEAQRRRVHLIEGDVRSARAPRADVVAAQNFSFFCFRTRAELRDYFKAARRHLGSEGMLMLDALGGSETHEEGHIDVQRHNGFRYAWELVRLDPISHHCHYAIHFRFRDGSEMKRAFQYHWRMWSIPEIRELLEEAGFSESIVYWERTDSETGEGDGTYIPRRSAEADPAWVAYIVAVK